MAHDSAHTRWWHIFEVIFGIPFLAAIALHGVVPLTVPWGFATRAMLLGGWGLISVGATFVVLARRAFAQRGQPTDPGRPTSVLVTSGVFSVSRNPLYFGGVCVLIGIALVLNLPWVVVLLLPALVACHYVLIVPEERYLADRFGTDYATYTATVHRWIGRVRTIRET